MTQEHEQPQPEGQEEMVTSSTSYHPDRENEKPTLFRTVPTPENPLRGKIEEILNGETIPELGGMSIPNATDRLEALFRQTITEARQEVIDYYEAELNKIDKKLDRIIAAQHPSNPSQQPQATK